MKTLFYLSFGLFLCIPAFASRTVYMTVVPGSGFYISIANPSNQDQQVTVTVSALGGFQVNTLAGSIGNSEFTCATTTNCTTTTNRQILKNSTFIGSFQVTNRGTIVSGDAGLLLKIVASDTTGGNSGYLIGSVATLYNGSTPPMSFLAPINAGRPF